jgi:hypothetical protein
MSDFTLSFEKYKNKTAKQIDMVVRNTALGLTKDIIYDTPVDQGRLRGNWQVSFDREINYSTIDKDKSGNKTADKAQNVILTSTIGKYIYIQNNLDYAEKIEFGGSPEKSPQGMVRINVIRWKAKLS